MSTYVDLKCDTCNVDAGVRENHAWAMMDLLLKCQKEAEALYAAYQANKCAAIAYGEDLPRWVVFFGEHAGHTVVVEDEYGHRPDECREFNVLEQAGQYHRDVCSKPPEHEGSHAWRRAW